MSQSTDCEAAHGNNVKGGCPRCGASVRVVGFQSCECGRELIEQLVFDAERFVRERIEALSASELYELWEALGFYRCGSPESRTALLETLFPSESGALPQPGEKK